MQPKLTLVIFFIFSFSCLSIGQTAVNDFYQVKLGQGKGIKFWYDTDNFKIHMGNTANNKYGPVSDYSIKMNMSDDPSRGWVWGVANKKPIAALNTLGNFQINGTMTTVGRVVIKSTNDAKGTTGSGGLEINGGLRIDNNEIITNANKPLFLNYDNNGKVVIGFVKWNELPGSYKLYVEKGILTEKVRVAVKNASDWADYVFEEDYDMLPIAKLEDYISTNKHLPNVPSADEVVKNGLDVASMDAKLLEKIEEAYLYIIDLQKQIDELKSNQN